jgi:3-hydroxyisobutyrate dehydrogenase-like beta-hydroxyacid dehydrogenase
MTTANKVTVIGLGSMGTALARAFIEKQFDVTVWNRNMDKAAPLVKAGATAAGNISEAINASPVIVICLSDYKVSNSLLTSIDLRGRTLIQLSTGTPKEARDLHAWAAQQGADCLNGDILAWPRQIGTDEATISVSGNKDIIHQHEHILKALAGTVVNMGEEPGASGAMFHAVLSYLAGSWIGFCHGALICEREGLKTDEFGSLLESISGILGTELTHMGKVIRDNSFTDPESTIKTTGLDLHLLVQQARESGINSELPAFAANLFQRAIDAGYENEEHAAVIKVLR